MRNVVVVSATATAAGKTWLGARLIEILGARGISAFARKPVQSFDPSTEQTDADVLAAASGETPNEVCPPHRWYERAMAPPMAAAALARPRFLLADLLSELSLPDHGVIFLEGVGGPRSPLSADSDTVGLATALRPRRVILVAHAGLGTINDVRLSAAAFQPLEVMLFLNRFDPSDELHERNRNWLAHVDRLEVFTAVGELAERLAQDARTDTPVEVR
jgi:dethiobiotin synthetase